jgi:hypothetical protein
VREQRSRVTDLDRGEGIYEIDNRFNFSTDETVATGRPPELPKQR